MLPTPDTSHVPYGRVYEPSEDSFLLMDTLASASETAFLQARFGRLSTADGDAGTSAPPPPLIVEIGSGSGVVLAFSVAQAGHLFGHDSSAVLALGVDVNAFACQATGETVRRAVLNADGKAAGQQAQKQQKQGPERCYLGAVRADLGTALRPGQVDVLLFNPPYVPTPELPTLGHGDGDGDGDGDGGDAIFDAAAIRHVADMTDVGSSSTRDRDHATFARDSHLLELAYAGGRDGMETTDRLLAALPHLLAPRGCAYVLLCAQNHPDAVKQRVRQWGEPVGSDQHPPGQRWRAETVGTSGRQAGWEKLQIVRIWRE